MSATNIPRSLSTRHRNSTLKVFSEKLCWKKIKADIVANTLTGVYAYYSGAFAILSCSTYSGAFN